jgi:MFS family permease
VQVVGPGYKWIALSNTTLGALMSSINATIIRIALPAIFKGIQIDPLAPGEANYFLWILLGYLVVTATLVVTFGRISDIFGRVRHNNLGFAIFTAASILLFLTPHTGNTAALEIIIFRIIQGVGAGFLLANGTAILTDAFPPHQRGLALGINQIAAIAGQFIGLVLGVCSPSFTGASSSWSASPSAIWHRLGLPEAARTRDHPRAPAH